MADSRAIAAVRAIRAPIPTTDHYKFIVEGAHDAWPCHLVAKYVTRMAFEKGYNRVVVKKSQGHVHEFSLVDLLMDTVTECGYWPQPTIPGVPKNLATIQMSRLSPEHGPMRRYIHGGLTPVSGSESGGSGG